MESVHEQLFELNLETVNDREYMPRISEVNLPCQWLSHCYNGKCPAFRKKSGNYYCARKNRHF